MVLGSTCFQKRYGSATALGKALYWGGKDILLTTEERALLMENTQALLSRFEAEEARLREEAEQKLLRLRAEFARRSLSKQASVAATIQIPGMRGMPLRGVFPWPWMMPGSSVAAFKLRDGSGWLRVQHKNRKHFIVPWPSFDGWEESLPPVVGRASLEARLCTTARLMGWLPCGCAPFWCIAKHLLEARLQPASQKSVFGTRGASPQRQRRWHPACAVCPAQPGGG